MLQILQTETPGVFLGVLADFHAERHPFSNFRFSNFASLPEDVFDFVEDGGVAVRGLVFHFIVAPSCSINFRWSRVSFVGVITSTDSTKSPLPPPRGSGKSLALDAKYGAALRAFRNLQFLFPVQPRHL